MTNLICSIFGHRWEAINDSARYCVRCNQVHIDTQQEPASTLDEIIQDRDWYRPKKKEAK